MAEKTIGLSRDLIIHPGETLNDVLEDRDISQTELARRTGISESHISNVISGKKDISVSFAKVLEYALNIDSSFWINLQANYDRENAEFDEINNITEEEINLLTPLKAITKHLRELGYIDKTSDKSCLVLELRKWMRISNLKNIPTLPFCGAFRVSNRYNVDLYVLCAWLTLCERQTSKIHLRETLNIKRLKESIPAIKSLMLNNSKNIQQELQNIFAECGIAFSIEKNFTGAPVQGYIKKNTDGTLALSMTIRGSFADIFWFTLFHEIGHIIHKDFGAKSFIDYNSNSDEAETLADEFARSMLINQEAYVLFLRQNDFSLEAINHFAESQCIPSYIVIGRLQKDRILNYNQYISEKIKYKWVD